MADLLMTRPHDAAQRFVAMLPETLTVGLQVIYSPLISVQPVGDDINLDSGEAVIFTSSNGVSATASIPDCNDRVAYCLGQRTSLKAKEAGWQALMCGKTADDLVANLLQHPIRAACAHARPALTRKYCRAAD